MPFKSERQRAFLAINKPEVAHKFAKHSGIKLKDLKHPKVNKLSKHYVPEGEEG